MICKLKNVAINRNNGKSLIYLLLCLLSLFSCIKVSVCTDCGENNQNVKDCLKNVVKLQNTHDLTEYNGITQLNDVCTKVDQTDQCLTRVGCDADNSGYLADWQGIKGAFHYLCGEGKQDFLAQKDCWDSAEAGRKIEACVQQLNQGTESEEGGVNCNSINTYIDCLRDKVAEGCNAQASNIIKIFVIKRIQPSAKLGGCVIDEEISSINSTPPTSGKPSLLITVFFSVFLVLLVSTY